MTQKSLLPTSVIALTPYLAYKAYQKYYGTSAKKEDEYDSESEKEEGVKYISDPKNES